MTRRRVVLAIVVVVLLLAAAIALTIALWAGGGEGPEVANGVALIS
jgi:hypothetical protein